MNLVKFLEILTAILFAFWFRKEIPLFAKRINQQTYDEFYSLVDFQLDYLDFEKKSNLKAKQSKLSILFYFIFPLITLLNQNYLISVVIIILCFLSVLDILYYLTDIRYLAILFLLTLYKGNLETFYFTSKKGRFWAGRQFIINRFIASFYIRSDVTTRAYCLSVRNNILPSRTIHYFAKTAKIAFYSVY